MELRDFQNFFFDLDKTIWNWDDTVIGAEDLIDTLRSTGKNVYFHTDNTLLSREQYTDKLGSKGIKTSKENILTSGHVAAKILTRKDIKRVYTIGESGLVDEMENEGLSISKDAENAVIGFDRKFNYSKLKRLMGIGSKGGKIYTCSTEKTFRRSRGDLPHQGPINSAVNDLCDTELVGKPSQHYRKIFKEYFSFVPGNSLLIGDRLADIQTGNRMGMKTAAVFSGEIDEERLKNADKDQVPDYALTSLHKLRKRII